MRRLLVLLLVVLTAGVAGAGELEIHFIDVGQGDAVLIRSPGGQNVLYDGGRSSGPVLRYLDAQGVRHLDLVIASHADADHIGGLVDVVARYRPGYVMDNGLSHTTATYASLLTAIAEAGSAYLEPTARTISLGDVTLRVLPPTGDAELGQNDNSVGLVLAYDGFAAALTGDAEAPQFGWWAEHHPELMTKVDVYKSSHHGSRNGDTPLSVDRFRPEVVVIGVGAHHPHGHPSAWAQRLYAAVDAEVLRTDLHGTVVAHVADGGAYRLVAAREGVPASPSQLAHVVDTTPGSGEAVVVCVHYDPAGRDDGREVVTIEALQEVDVTGWVLEDAVGHAFVLPSRVLAAGETLEVPNPGRPVWNNASDDAVLRSRSGLVDGFSYGGGGSAACR